MWSQTSEPEKNQRKAEDSRYEANQVLAYRVREHNKKSLFCTRYNNMCDIRLYEVIRVFLIVLRFSCSCLVGLLRYHAPSVAPVVS